MCLTGCYISYRRGFRMVQRLVRDSIHVRNLAECELECSRTRPFTCQTFHFRYETFFFDYGCKGCLYSFFFFSRYTNLDGGYDRNPYNCELSELSARDFDRYRDMVDDRDYELFTRSQFSSCTQGLSGECWVPTALKLTTIKRDTDEIMPINSRHQIENYGVPATIIWCNKMVHLTH